MLQQIHDSSRRIFLADDDDDDRSLFAEALSEIDSSIVLTEVLDGKQLIEALTVSKQPLPEFVFIDINMPVQDGLECLEAIRKKEGDLKEIPIIMLSTSSNPETIKKAFRLGASYYAIKPNSFNGLKLLIKSALTADISYRGLIPNREFEKADK